MPRKRTMTDEVLLDHALAVLREVGPDALTFGAVATMTGLAASTIVQRFGSKPALLRAALLRAWDRLDDDTAAAVAAAGRGAEGAIDLLVRLSGQYEEHDYADQLRLLREDLRDPALTDRGRAWLAVLAEAIEARVPGVAGMLVLAQWQGTLTVWSFTREAPIEEIVRRNLREFFRRR